MSILKWLSLLIVSFIISCSLDSMTLKTDELLPLNDQAVITKYIANSKFKIVNVLDSRNLDNKSLVGYAKTGIGRKKTPIYLDQDLNSYLSDQFNKGFKQRGVLSEKDAKYLMKIDVSKFIVSESDDGKTPERSICDSIVEFHLLDLEKNNTLWTGKVSMNIGSPSSIETTMNNGPTMQSCVNMTMEELLKRNDIRSKLEIKIQK